MRRQDIKSIQRNNSWKLPKPGIRYIPTDSRSWEYSKLDEPNEIHATTPYSQSSENSKDVGNNLESSEREMML